MLRYRHSAPLVNNASHSETFKMSATGSTWTEGYPSEWFIGPVSDDLVCGICYDVLSDPHQCPNGHCFCLSCISTSLKLREACPACNHVLTAKSLTKIIVLRNLILGMKVKCSNNHFGIECAWTGTLLEREAHIRMCS